MKVAVISDVHANLEALEAVLSDIDGAGAESIICLGDIYGYGPNPEETVRLIRSLSIPCLMGNHELALMEPEFFDWFNETARESLLLSEELISFDTRNWLSRLDATLIFQGALFVHGCPPASITEYIFEWNDSGLEFLFSQMERRFCFVGHTHTLEAVSFNEGKIRRHALKQGIFSLNGSAKYIISVGSVGQPRDGNNNNAKYLIWDSIEQTVEIRFVPYDIAKTAAKIVALGFPESNAWRLW
jgi:diadenosine tetraphosphatase ApaH/serine/threonine PP2A family protein phosphatase